MSFMYNPFPFDDPKPINRPKLSEETINSIVTGGTPNVAKKFIAEIAAKVKSEGVIVGIDGYTTANWKLFVDLLARVRGHRLKRGNSQIRQGDRRYDRP